MNSNAQIQPFDRPFPALTPAQRYSLDIMGYVIVPDTLSPDEVGTLREALHKIKRDLGGHLGKDVPGRLPHQPYAAINNPHHIYMGGILEADPCLTAFASHPRLVSMVEELMGGEARIVEFNSHINSRVPGKTFEAEPTFGFHRGTDMPFASHIKNDLYHCNFVKTLTMLTDLGPDDGGTVVVAGSHKLETTKEVIECAYADRSLIHQVVAPAGSTLLFSETLIHATGEIRSDNERTILICGYGASMFPYWDGSPQSETFTANVPPEFQTLFLGRRQWTRGPRYRTLADPVDARSFTLKDGYWPAPDHIGGGAA